MFGRRKHDDDVEREIKAHLEAEAAERQADGATADEARYAAQREFGNVAIIREEIGLQSLGAWLESIVADFRYAVRLLRKTPGFTAVAVASLTIGIGANTAVFSVANAVLLRSLPYPAANQLMRVGGKPLAGDVSMPEFGFLREHNRVFSSVAGYRGVSAAHLTTASSQATDSGQEWIRALRATDGLPATLGYPLLAGRDFSRSETSSGGPRAIILTYDLWQRRFGGDPLAIGKSLRLDGEDYTIAGVLPASFWFPQSCDAVLPIRAGGGLDDAGTNTQMIARRQEGVSAEQVTADLDNVSAAFRREFQMNAFRGYQGISFQQHLAGDNRPILVLLLAATGVLLLIACSNLVSLLLARLSARTQELSVRLALGSGRSRLFRQLLFENLLLTFLGAAGGVACAYAIVRGVIASVPMTLMLSEPVRVDGVVLAYTLVVALISAIAFTVLPFMNMRRIAVPEVLRGTRSSASRGRQFARSTLVVSQVALATVLLIASTLLTRSLYLLVQEPLGFATHNLVSFETPLLATDFKSPEARAARAGELHDALRRLPGVREVAATNILPLNGPGNLPTQRFGHPEQSIGGMEIRVVSPAFFQMLNIHVNEGRAFTTDDRLSSPSVAVVNASLAKAWWGAASPINDAVEIGKFRGKVLIEGGPRTVVW